MADAKNSAFTSLAAGGLASTDILPLVDVSDTTMASSGTNKRTTIIDAGLFGGVPGNWLSTKDNSAADGGSLHFDSNTAGARVSHTISQNIATDDFTLWFRPLVPSSAPAATIGIGNLSSSSSTGVAVSAFAIYVDTSGQLVCQIYGPGSTSDTRTVTYATFITDFGGQIVDIHFVRTAATPSGILYINGVAVTTAAASTGTDPTWAATVTSTNLNLGIFSATQIWGSRIYVAALYNRALTQAEVQSTIARDISFSDQWGSQTAIITYVTPTLNGGFETAGGGGADVFGSWVETVAGTSTVNDETVNTHSGSHALRIDVDSSNDLAQVSQTVLTIGKRYRYKLWAYCSSSSGQMAVGSGSGTGINNHTLTTSYAQYTGEFTATNTTFVVKRQNAGGTASTSIYADDVELYTIGAMLDSDLLYSNPLHSTTVRDRSTNSFTGTANSSTGVVQMNPFKQINTEFVRINPSTGKSGSSGVTSGWFNVAAATYTDNATAGSGTAASFAFNSLSTPTLAATNTSVVTTDAATWYIAAAPSAGTNMTITNAYALWVDAGTARFDGTVIVGNGEGGTPGNGTFRGANGTGSNITAGQLIVTAGLGTGTGGIGVISFSGALAKAASGSTAHTLVTTLFQLGASQSSHPATSGFAARFGSQTLNDENTAGSGTASTAMGVTIGTYTLSATNTSVVTTSAAAFYIANSVQPGTNMTLTNSYAFWIDNGFTRLDDAVSIAVGGPPTASLDINVGSLITAPASTTSGYLFRSRSATFTNTTSSGTVGFQTANSFGIPTMAASSVTTFTDAATIYVIGPPAAGSNVTITNAWSILVDSGDIRLDGNLNFANASGGNIVTDTTTGTKIATATSQKLGLWNATPIIQPTTAGAAATFVTNTSGTVNDTATWDGYTIGQVVKALRNMGALA